jgi:Lar family restriction alleviation protein
MSKPRLLACPFCGSGLVNIDLVYGYGIRDEHQAACRNCGASAASTPSRADAAMFWNRRARPASQPSQHSKWTKSPHTVANQQARPGKAKKNREE